MKSITGQLHDYKMLLLKPLSLNLKVSAVGMIIEGSVKVRGKKISKNSNNHSLYATPVYVFIAKKIDKVLFNI